LAVLKVKFVLSLVILETVEPQIIHICEIIYDRTHTYCAVDRSAIILHEIKLIS